MENFNAITSDASAFTVTDNTTLGELLAILNLGDKPHETPTPKMLRETAGAPIATEERCTVYANGYAVYDNGSGRTVVWLPSCTSFTYHFDALKESEKGGEVKETAELPEGLLVSLPWPVAVSLIGDHRVEANMMNRMGSRTGTKDYDSDDNGDKGNAAGDAGWHDGQSAGGVRALLQVRVYAAGDCRTIMHHQAVCERAPAECLGKGKKEKRFFS